MAYPIHLPKQAGDHLRALRVQQGMSQAEVAVLLGVSQSRVAQIENRPGIVSLEQFLAFVQAIGGQLWLTDPTDTSEPVPGTATNARSMPRPPARPRTRPRQASSPAASLKQGEKTVLFPKPKKGSW